MQFIAKNLAGIPDSTKNYNGYYDADKNPDPIGVYDLDGEIRTEIYTPFIRRRGYIFKQFVIVFTVVKCKT